MIKKEEVEHIAKLARISLNPKEIEQMQKELSSILDYFKLLNELDVSKVNPAFYSIPLKNVTREDIVKEIDKDEKDKILEQVPLKKEKYIKVKEILK